MTAKTALPAIRSRVGDWNYYVTTLTFAEVASLIKSPDEIHERKRLADWIQREAIEKHADQIADYILHTPQRLLGSLIVGVYGGRPDWTPISIKFPAADGVTKEQQRRIGENLGVLLFTGGESLFPIDGQHRVAGIKQSLQRMPDDEVLKGDSVSAIFVGHDPKSTEGKVRTRRLFTTVNKKAKVVSKAARIALDEDDGFAVVTRTLIDTHWLFEDARSTIAYGSAGSIPTGDNKALTSVVGLYELLKDLYGAPRSKGFDKSRPNDAAIEDYLAVCMDLFDALLASVPEYKKVFKQGIGEPGDYRVVSKNHLLFRPVGQRAFCKALQLLIARGMKLREGIKVLLKADLYIQKRPWHHILWDPISKTMITTKLVMAETQLLRLAGQPPRTKRNSANLDALLKSVGNIK
jgi:DNA sulfur modification protein DndB